MLILDNHLLIFYHCVNLSNSLFFYFSKSISLLKNISDLYTFHKVLKYLLYLFLLLHIISIVTMDLVDILTLSHIFYKMNILMLNNNKNIKVLLDKVMEVQIITLHMMLIDLMLLIPIRFLNMVINYISFYLYAIFDFYHCIFL